MYAMKTYLNALHFRHFRSNLLVSVYYLTIVLATKHHCISSDKFRVLNVRLKTKSPIWWKIWVMSYLQGGPNVTNGFTDCEITIPWVQNLLYRGRSYYYYVITFWTIFNAPPPTAYALSVLHILWHSYCVKITL